MLFPCTYTTFLNKIKLIRSSFKFNPNERLFLFELLKIELNDDIEFLINHKLKSFI